MLLNKNTTQTTKTTNLELNATNSSQKLASNNNKKLTSEIISSMPSLSQVLEMGFSVESVEHALGELGEDTRPERLVSWLLQHPELHKVSYLYFRLMNRNQYILIKCFIIDILLIVIKSSIHDRP